MAPVTRSATRASIRVTRSCAKNVAKFRERKDRASLIQTLDFLRRDIKKTEARYNKLLKEAEYLNSITCDAPKTSVCVVCSECKKVVQPRDMFQCGACTTCVERTLAECNYEEQ